MANWFNRNANYCLIAGLLVLYIISVIIHLGHFNLEGEEPRRAIVAIEMLESGNYIVPYSLGWEYYNKPPVFSWVLAGFMWLSGSSSEFILRLPSLVFLLLWAFFHYRVCKKYFSPGIALLSGFFLLTAPDIFFYALTNGAEIDIFYSFIVYLQVISMFWFYENKKWAQLFIFSYLFCAIGFLTKGFPSLMFQGLTLLALCVYARSWRILIKPQHLAGLLVFLLLTGSYIYIYSARSSTSALIVNLVNESLGKSVSGESLPSRLFKFIIYPLSILKLLAPWSLLFLVFFAGRKYFSFSNPLVRFSFLFIVFNIGVYWVSGASKLRYVYMFMPFFIIILTQLYKQMVEAKPVLVDRFLRWAGLVFCLILGSILALPFFYKLNGSILFVFALLFLLFLFSYYKTPYRTRIWFFIGGLILCRFVYATIGIPLQKKGMFDYGEQVKTLAIKTNKPPINLWLAPDTLDLNIILVDTLYKWRKKPVLVPPFLHHQLPYYYYRSTGNLMKLDTALTGDQYYLAYRNQLASLDVEPIYSFYDQRRHDSLCLFKLNHPH